MAKNTHKAPTKAPKGEPDAIHVGPEHVAQGQLLDSALASMADAKATAHKVALELRAALMPKGKYKDQNDKFYLPHIAAWLQNVYSAQYAAIDAISDPAAQKREANTLKARAKRLLQVIASTTEKSLGRSKDAAKLAAKRKKEAHHKGGKAEGKDTSPKLIPLFEKASDVLNSLKAKLKGEALSLAAELQDLLDELQDATT